MSFDGDDYGNEDVPAGDIDPKGDHHSEKQGHHHHRHQNRHQHHHRKNDKDQESGAQKKKINLVSKQSTVRALGSDEQLGDNFRDTPWQKPDRKLAWIRWKEHMFHDGKGSIWGVTVDEINELGTGIGAYFMLLKSFTKMMLISCVLVLPHIIVARHGRYGEDAFATSNSLGYQIFLHSAGHHAYVDPKVNQMEYCGSTEPGFQVDTAFEANIDCSTEWLYKIPLLKNMGFSTDLILARHASMIITLCDFFNCIILVTFVFAMKRKVKAMISKYNATACDVSSYSIFVRGLPKDATIDEILNHFSNLYKLDEPDWAHNGMCCGCIGRKKSRRPEDILFASGKRGEKQLYPVKPGAAMNAQEPYRYDHKWVAEVEVIHPMDEFLRTMRRNSKKSKQLLVDRARWKKCKRFEHKWGGTMRLSAAEKRVLKTEKKIKRLKDKLKGMKRMMRNINDVCVGAFVVFNHEESVKRCLQDYSRKSFWHRLCYGQHNELRFRGTHKLKVVPADKPGNILWENINIGRYEARLRKMLSFVLTFLCMLISFFAIFFATMEQKRMAREFPIPTTEVCEEQIPAAYTTSNKPSWLYKENMCSGENEFYITFEETLPSYKSASLVDDCVAPCISFDDTTSHTCVDKSDSSISYEYSPAQVLFCYCVDRMSSLVQEKGFFEGPQELLSDDVCGDFAKDYSQIQTLTTLVSILVPLVNEILKMAIKWIGNFQRNKTTTQRSISVAKNTFFALYFNTALLLLFVNGKIRIFANIHLNQDNSIARSDYDELWYATVGVAITSIMCYNIIIPHLKPLLTFAILPIKRAFHGDGLTQYELDSFYLTEKFEMEQKCAQFMQTIAVTLTFSAGIPILFPIAFISLILMFWSDKIFLLRYHTRPTVVQGELGKKLLELVPYIVMVHLANAFWMYAYRPSQGYDGEESNQNPDLKAGGLGYIGGVFEADLQDSRPEYYNHVKSDGLFFGGLDSPLFIRLNRQHCQPIFVLFCFLALFYLVINRFLVVLLWLLTKIGCCSAEDAAKALASKRQFNPPFTEEYMKQIRETWSVCSRKFVRKEQHLEASLGWREKKVKGPNDKEYSYICRMKDASTYESTWEVIKHDGLHTYQMRYNDVYANIFHAFDLLLKEDDGGEEGSATTGVGVAPIGASRKVKPVMPP